MYGMNSAMRKQRFPDGVKRIGEIRFCMEAVYINCAKAQQNLTCASVKEPK